MLACAVHQPLDLALGEIAPFDCQVYDGWCAFLRSRFHADKPCLRGNDCLGTFFAQLTKGGELGNCIGTATSRRRGPRGGALPQSSEYDAEHASVAGAA